MIEFKTITIEEASQSIIDEILINDWVAFVRSSNNVELVLCLRKFESQWTISLFDPDNEKYINCKDFKFYSDAFNELKKRAETWSKILLNCEAFLIEGEYN